MLTGASLTPAQRDSHQSSENIYRYVRQNGSPDELFLLQMALFKENMEEWRQRPAVKEWVDAGLAAAAKQRRPLSTAA